MAIEWLLIFQGISAASAAVQAVKAALEARKLTREEVKAIAATAEASAPKQPRQPPEIDPGMRDAVDRKIKEAKKRWQEALDTSDDQKDWSKATDRFRSDICAILRLLKQVNGGILPDDLYEPWTANQCS